MEREIVGEVWGTQEALALGGTANNGGEMRRADQAVGEPAERGEAGNDEERDGCVMASPIADNEAKSTDECHADNGDQYNVK